MSKLWKEVSESFDFNRAAIAKQRLQNLRQSGRRVRGARIANLMRMAGLKEEELDEQDLDQLDEVLNKDAEASDWIKDFVHSTNPKFEGKTKKERIKMALGAYYGKQREKTARVEEQVKTDDKDSTPPFDPPYKKTSDSGTTTDKSGAKHTPMSKARHLARMAMKKQNVKEETETSEKHEMAETQLHFIKYAAEEILEYIKTGGQIEEWYQNKLSKVQSEVESLHSFIEGESRRLGMKEETTRVAKPVNVDKIHTAGQEPHEEKFETFKKKPVKEEFDEEGNLIISKISFNDFITMLEGRAQYIVKATHKDTGRVKVSNYVADKDESEYGVRSRAEREHRPSGYQIDSIRRKDIEAHGEGDDEETSSTTQKRGRGRPAGSKSGARGPRIK